MRDKKTERAESKKKRKKEKKKNQKIKIGLGVIHLINNRITRHVDE